MGNHRVEQEIPNVLAMNVGSSSIRFSTYHAGRMPQRQMHGTVDRVGAIGTTLTFEDPVRKGSVDIGYLDRP